MALDSASKRASAINMGFVVPDGVALDATDRQASGWFYGGVLASGVIPVGGVTAYKVAIGNINQFGVTHLSSRHIRRIGR